MTASVRPPQPPAPDGLTADDARARLAEHGPNALPAAEREGFATRLSRQLREPMSLLLLAAAGISGILLGERIDALAIVAIVALNAAIALVQEGRAEDALEKLEALEAPGATVVRDGRRRRVDAAELVPGDVVVVQAGDRVPADPDILSGTGLEADEAVLTGESLPVAKRPGGTTEDGALGERDGRLHSGTMVTRGTGSGVVAATGAETGLGAIAASLRDIRREPTPLQRHLRGLTQRLGVAATVIAAGTFALALVMGQGRSVDEAFLTAVALAVAAVPEGLAAVTTVALALGVGRMARQGAIVRRLSAVETLGATDVLVIDKTGTVTENRMRVSVVIDPGGGIHPAEGLPPGLRDRLIPILVLCSDATLDPPTGDPMERALLEIVPFDAVDLLRRSAPRLVGAPFSSDRKRMSSVHTLDGGLQLLVKGAPEVVLERCVAGPGGAASSTLDAVAVAALLALADERAAAGERLLALATRPLCGVPDDPEAEEHDLVLECLVALRDPPRTSAAGSVEAIRDAGVTLLMATGDHPATAAAIGREIGLAAAEALTGADLRRDGIPAAPTSTVLYARVDPDQKLALVDRLQTLGHTVAMTGDGVNDAPALRSADIGVALGASGSDVARGAADLVITDDDLATIVVAVREGRGIYDNLRKVIDYLVAANLSEVMVVIGALLLLPVMGVPLFPLQLLWINLLTDGLPALALGVDPVDESLMHAPPRPRSTRLLDAPHLRRLASRAVVLAVGGLGALLVSHHMLDLPIPQSRTVLFTTLVVAQMLYAFVVRRTAHRSGAVRRPPRNPWLLASAGVALGLHLLIVLLPTAQRVFDTVPLPASGWAVAAVAGVLGPLAVAAMQGQPPRPPRRPGRQP